MNTYRLKSSKPYKIIKCKRGKNLTRINISSECRNSKSITSVAGNFLSAVYLPGKCQVHFQKPCLIHAAKPALFSKIELSSAIIPSQRNLLVAVQLKHGCP